MGILSFGICYLMCPPSSSQGRFNLFGAYNWNLSLPCFPREGAVQTCVGQNVGQVKHRFCHAYTHVHPCCICLYVFPINRSRTIRFSDQPFSDNSFFLSTAHRPLTDNFFFPINRSPTILKKCRKRLFTVYTFALRSKNQFDAKLWWVY